MKSPRILPVLAASVLTFVLFGACDGEDSTPAPDEEGIADDEKAVDPSTTAEESDSKTAGEEGAVSPLKDGVHSAFGLKMPRGMIPIKLPTTGVSRFEGTHGLDVVRRYLKMQLEMPVEPIAEEKDTILIRQATVIKGGEEGVRLAVRIFTGSLGGASVDVWKETVVFDPKNPKASVSKAPPMPSLSGEKADGAQRAEVPRTKFERRRQVWEMMEKVRRGEKLTPQDMENPYFH